MTISNSARCSATVYTPGGAINGTRCSKKAKLIEGGRAYCTVHAPSYKARKLKAKLEDARQHGALSRQVLDALGRYVEKREKLIEAIMAVPSGNLPREVRIARRFCVDAREHLEWARAQRGTTRPGL
jgi:hypothetical protein